MLSNYFREHFSRMPTPQELNGEQARRLLIDGYRYLIAARLRAYGIPVDDTEGDLSTTLDVLARLANYLSTYSALCYRFPQAGQHTDQTARSANFVAAQVFEFLAEHQARERGILLDALSEAPEITTDQVTGNEFWSDEAMHWLNAAAHYLLAGHDGNAVTLMKWFRILNRSDAERDSSPWLSPSETSTGYSRFVASVVLRTLECNFAWINGQADRQREFLVSLRNASDKIGAFDLAILTVLIECTQACFDMAVALTSLPTANSNTSRPWEVSIARATEGARILQDPGLIWLSLLLERLFDEFGRRGLLFLRPPSAPEPPANWPNYLQTRAQQGRALLWPPHLEALENDYLNIDLNCVVSMPPGAGKSFVAELRIASVLAGRTSGWILYLVPTNALARQVEDDLKMALVPLLATEQSIKRFVTDIEYNFLVDEQLPVRPLHYVAVMTPERLRLALAVSPGSFETCQLCVVDEAHLIGEEKRGALLDLVLAQLRSEYPQIRYMLLSAMMSNPKDLARWLEGTYVQVSWRPTRQAMMVGIPATLLNSSSHGYQRAGKSESSWKTDLCFVSVYHHDWDVSQREVRLIALDGFASFTSDRNHKAYSFKATETARNCAVALAQSGLKTLIFLPHQSVEKSAKEVAEVLNVNLGIDPELNLWTRLLNREFGEVSSQLVDCLQRGTCYHKAAMQSEEQHLSERFFSNSSKKIRVMVATSTLSYGMNLPVEALIFAGDKRFDSDTQQQVPIEAKDFVNMAGRAGRPAFANQGLVQVIPNWNTYQSPRTQFDAMRAQYLTATEDDFPIGSGLSVILDQIEHAASDSYIGDEVSAIATAWTGKLNDQNLLHSTYAFFVKTNGTEIEKQDYSLRISQALRQWIEQQEREFPLSSIMQEAFRRSGLPSRTCRHLYAAATDILAEHSLDTPELQSGTNSFYTWLTLLLPYVQHETCDFFFRPRVRIGDTGQRNNMSVVWAYETQALIDWLNGQRIAELIQSSFVRQRQVNSGQLRDRAIKFTEKTTQQYAFALGSMLFFLETAWREQDPHARPWTRPIRELVVPWPQHLLHLPLAAKWGLDSLSSLVWKLLGVRFRFACRILGEIYPIDRIDEFSRNRFARLLRDLRLNYDRNPQLVVAALRIQSEQQGMTFDNNLLLDVADACFLD